MGTDIHGGFIKVTKDVDGNVVEKQPIKTEYDFGRDYTLFAILAGVRNGYGFAGSYRHEPLTPIAEGRGLPTWLSMSKDEDDCEMTHDLHNKWYGSEWLKDEPEMGEYMGDHSFTYMTVKEMLDWEGWSIKLARGGVVDKEHYLETIAKGKEPEYWCGGVSGGYTKVVLPEQMNDEHCTHVACTWTDKETLGESYKWFLDILKGLDEDTYLVIGFDS